MPDTAGMSELWIRVSRIKECCNLCVDVVAHPPGWCIRIEPRDQTGRVAEASSEHLVDAMDRAIARAEAMGLHPGHI